MNALRFGSPAALFRYAARKRRASHIGALCFLVFAGYYLGTRVGLALTFLPNPISVLWPPNAILFAALLLVPFRMWPIVAACIDAGFTTLAPTLPGHGTDPEDLVGVTWDDWLEAARSWEADVVVGQSMGACIGLQLAVEQRCSAVVCINPVVADPES